MPEFLHILQNIGFGLGYLFVAFLCLVAVVLSCVSITGGWLVSLAAIIALLLGKTPYPTWSTIIAFLVISAAIEGVEFMAGTWGVTKRGGSGWAGVAALIGTIFGALTGTFIFPIPLIGSLLGMLVFGFAFVFLAEYHIAKKKDTAAHVAWGSVIARVFVIFLKVSVTVGMIIYLVMRMIFSV